MRLSGSSVNICPRKSASWWSLFLSLVLPAFSWSSLYRSRVTLGWLTAVLTGCLVTGSVSCRGVSRASEVEKRASASSSCLVHTRTSTIFEASLVEKEALVGPETERERRWRVESKSKSRNEWLSHLKEEGHVDVVVKMLVHEGALLEHLLGEWPLEVHHQFQHLVVRVPSKGDVSREELVDDAPHAPHVHGVAVGQPQNHLRGPVEARDEVGRQVVVPSVHGAAEVTELHLRVRRVHQNVVGLDVGVEDPASSQQLERRQQLKRVGLHGVQVDTHASAELLHDLPQVHAQRLKDHADVVAVLEGVDQVDAVLLAPRIRPGQLLQNAHFLLRRLAHHLVRPHHLDRVLLRTPFPIPVATSIATASPLE
mmetsp:Transcript_1379/g.3523  ORF Transcript_1379/g.3523 Transcript_1379/m.3523 type:complete len:368 (+) Transcript_1379:105-1208(+)